MRVYDAYELNGKVRLYLDTYLAESLKAAERRARREHGPKVVVVDRLTERQKEGSKDDG